MSTNLNDLDIKKLFGELIKHENKLKWLSASEVGSKRKEMVKEENWEVSLKASSSKKKKVKDASDSSNEGSSKEEDIGLFVKGYNNI